MLAERGQLTRICIRHQAQEWVVVVEPSFTSSGATTYIHLQFKAVSSPKTTGCVQKALLQA